MRRSGRFMLPLLFLSSFAPLAAAQSPHPVGVAYRSLLKDDPSYDWRGSKVHALSAVVWYPAGSNGVETRQWVGDPAHPFASAGSAAENAPIAAAPARFPLILLSHGTGGSALMMAWLGTQLAARGYIAAAVNHPGNNAVDGYTVQGFTLGWERAVDLSKVLDGVLADPQFGPRIDSHRVGAAGFSLGGYTMMVIAGGVARPFRPADLRRECNQRHSADIVCLSPPEFPGLTTKAIDLAQSDPAYAAALDQSIQSHRDPRVRAVFAIAPVNLWFVPASLRAISIPVEIVVGASDPIAPPATNAEVFAHEIPGATLTVYPGGVAHYTFLDDCAALGVEQAPGICTDKSGVDRAAIHEETARRAATFFAKSLTP